MILFLHLLLLIQSLFPPMPNQLINENGVYTHPEYTEDAILADGSQTLLEMLYNVKQRDEKSDFLGTIVNSEVVYESYEMVCGKIERLGNALREINQKLSVNDEYKDNVNNDEEIHNDINNDEEIDNDANHDKYNKSKNNDKGLNEEDDTNSKLNLNLIGIFSVNRAEWVISEYAIYSANCTNCPLYSTFGLEAISHILNETEMKICFVSGAKAKTLLQAKSEFLRVVVSYDELEKELVDEFSKKGIEVVYYKDLLMSNEKEMHKNEDENSTKSELNKSLSLITGESIATVCYTSGTSGKPKGVLLSHTNFICTVLGFMKGINNNAIIKITKKDVYISYLPLAHVMERAILAILTANGARIAFFRGNPRKLGEDMKIIKPTFFAGVPRVFDVFKENIEKAIMSKGFFKRSIVNFTINLKIMMQRLGFKNLPIGDSFILAKIKKEFGGQIRAALNGSAPISKNVIEYLQAALNFRIFQGYGQTEATAANILQTISDNTNDNVGIPFPSNKIKLIPTEQYNKPNMGEVCIKGRNVTRGYYKQPLKTKNVFLEDGWLRTGDVAVVDNSCFRIIARVKDTFKTSHGEYINPEKLENIFKGGFINDIYICGDKFKKSIIAIVVCMNENITEEEILSKIKEKGQKMVEKNELSKFEIPSKIIVKRREFGEMGELITPTGKKRRAEFEEVFKVEIERLSN